MSPEHFARMRGLQAAYTSSNSRLLDHPDIARQLDGKLKRVQFDTPSRVQRAWTTSAASWTPPVVSSWSAP